MARKRKKMGRPKKKAKDRRTALITLRLTKEQRRELERDAKAEGLSLSSYLLKCGKGRQ